MDKFEGDETQVQHFTSVGAGIKSPRLKEIQQEGGSADMPMYNSDEEAIPQ